MSSCIVASSRMFWQSWWEQVQTAEPTSEITCTVVAYSQDATNRSVFNKQKLHSLMMEGSFAVVSRKKDVPTSTSLPTQWHTIKRLSDVLPITDGSGRATAAMSQKLLSVLGCPTWYSFASGSGANLAEDQYAGTRYAAFAGNEKQVSLPCLNCSMAALYFLMFR